jgi:hypothetical protein
LRDEKRFTGDVELERQLEEAGCSFVIVEREAHVACSVGEFDDLIEGKQATEISRPFDFSEKVGWADCHPGAGCFRANFSEFFARKVVDETDGNHLLDRVICVDETDLSTQVEGSTGLDDGHSGKSVDPAFGHITSGDGACQQSASTRGVHR